MKNALMIRLLAGAATLGLAAPAIAVAQNAPSPAAEAGEDSATLEAVVVTGSRLIRDGSQAPTPVTVVGAEQLGRSAPSNIADGLNQLPQFQNSSSQNSYGQTNANEPFNGNYLNLRGVGAQRSLVLFDGQRVPPTNFNGGVDVNTLPQMLVQRVDVVTAGASAAYGSDAVSGVVNYVIDRKFSGLKYDVQGGVSSRNDAGSYKVGVAAGADFLDGRGHIMASAERYDVRGLDRTDRRFATELYSLVGGGTNANPNRTYDNTRLNFATFGGVLLAAGQRFDNAGNLVAFNPGAATGNPSVSIGGDGAYFDALGLTGSLKTNQLFSRAQYQVTPSLTAFAQGSYADALNVGHYGYDFHFANIFISPDNAFLTPAQKAVVAAVSPPGGATVFSRFNRDLGRRVSYAKNKNYNFSAGLEGEIGDYKWDARYNYGKNSLSVRASEVDNQRFYAAIDAVADANGKAVCRATLTNPGLYPGCVPINLFGEGRASAEAIAYVRGDSRYQVDNILNDVAFNLRGDLFSLPAGAVSVAIGAEWRKAQLEQTSNSDPGVPVDFTGVRNVPPSTLAYGFTNVGTAKGSYTVKETYIEATAPLLKDHALARSLELNGAFRHTDYSTSGGVDTWKVGFVYQPIEDLRLRATRSADIRAPTLYDLFAGRSVNLFGLDIAGQGNFPVQAVSAGNAALDPERSKTTSFGGVYAPGWLPGLRLSVDYFDLKIKDAIITSSAQQEWNDCVASNKTAPVCSLIQTAAGVSVPTAILVSPLNNAVLRVRGVDVEASYAADLGPGRLTLRGLASYTPHFEQQASATAAAEELAGNANSGEAHPKLRGALSADYAWKGLNIHVQERMVGRFLRSTRSTAVTDYQSNHVPDVFYTDLNISYKTSVFGHDVEPFLNVSDLFDRQAPLYASALPGLSYPGNQQVHSVMGRYFTVGFHGKF